jgi:hypothetical protein
MCELCDDTISDDALDCLDAVELREMLWCISRQICPICFGPCPIRPEQLGVVRAAIVQAIQNWEVGHE